MGPTGKRLWATRIDVSPGFHGQFHYIHHTPELTDPLTVEFTDGAGQVLSLRVIEREWQPSHRSVRFGVEGRDDASVLIERWITEDDVLVGRYTAHQLGRFGVRWRSPLALEPVGDLGRFTTVSLVGLANEDLIRSTVLRRGGPLSPIYVEAEDNVRQVGSTGTDRKAAASGGRVLGAEFGAVKGHEASYELVGTGEGRWTLVARYARGLPGAAAFAVAIRGERVGGLACASTGGWGNAEQDFALQRLDLGELQAGQLEMTITAEANGANTNFDGFFLVPTEAVAGPLPPREQWRQLDPMRGGARLPGGRLVVDGVPLAFLPPMGPQGVFRQNDSIPVSGRGSRLHVLALPVGPDARVECAGVSRRLGARRRVLGRNMVSLEVPADGSLALTTHDCVLLALTREDVGDETTSHLRRGHQTYHGVPTEVRVGLHGLARPWNVEADGEAVQFHVTMEMTGNGVPGAATEAALEGADTLARHRRDYASWYAANAPRLESDDDFLTRLWTYRWFLVRHNLADPAAGYLLGGPVVYEGRHGSWYPRVITFSTPHIIAETRWLADTSLFLGNVNAVVAAQSESGVFPNVLVDWTGSRYINWIPQAVVEAFKARPDRGALQRLWPALVRNVGGNAREFDKDGDGLLAAGDHYATGMEFQPSSWALDGYDNSLPQTQLERPDFNAYHHANAMALAEAAHFLGDETAAVAMRDLAAKTRDAVLATLWNAEDEFFYSVREADGAPARCKEVIGFYPFRFGLVPAGEPYDRALSALVDPLQFWTPFPLATCSMNVPVYSAMVQHWPGPGGVTAACMWNGPTWPHANSLVADAMATVIRRDDSPLRPAQLGAFLKLFGALHCEGGDRRKLLLREYANAETGVGQGCPDYMHSTFNDLIIRHAAGLVPRFDDVIEVRPLRLGLGDFAIEDIPYHGHRMGIAVRGETVTVTLDGERLGEGSVDVGLHLAGFLK